MRQAYLAQEVQGLGQGGAEWEVDDSRGRLEAGPDARLRQVNLCATRNFFVEKLPCAKILAESTSGAVGLTAVDAGSLRFAVALRG